MFALPFKENKVLYVAIILNLLCLTLYTYILQLVIITGSPWYRILFYALFDGYSMLLFLLSMDNYKKEIDREIRVR